MKISVSGRKGGVGKTTVSCGLASIFASQGKRTLVVDLDPQSNSAYVLGTDPSAPGTADLLAGKHPEPIAAADNLYVLPGGPGLSGYEVQSAVPEDLGDAVESLDYDIIIFDCPPGAEYLERMAWIAADVALICTNAHPLAVMGAGRVLGELKARHQKQRQGAKRWAFVLTMIDRRRTLDLGLSEELSRTYPNVEHLFLHQDSSLAWAMASRLPLMDSEPKCKGAKDLQQIVEWLNG